MKAKGKPHDPGRDQRLKIRSNRARLSKRIIHRFRRSINRKARSEAVKLAGGRPRNAHPFSCKEQAAFCLSRFALNVKDYREG